MSASSADQNGTPPFSAANLELIKLASLGYSRAAMAELTSRTPIAIDAAFRRMFVKAGARNRSHLACIALREGWIR